MHAAVAFTNDCNQIIIIYDEQNSMTLVHQDIPVPGQDEISKEVKYNI